MFRRRFLILFDIHIESVYNEIIMPQTSPTHQRLNITLPHDTVRLLDRVSPAGERSRMIDEAVRWFIADKGRQRLRERLKEGATVRAQRDLELAADWFSLEEEAWKPAHQ